MSDLTDPNVIKDRKRRLSVKDQQDQEDIRKVLSTPEGRRLVWRMMDQTKMLAPDLFSPDPQQLSYQTGKRDVGVWLYAEIVKADPQRFIEMITGDR